MRTLSLTLIIGLCLALFPGTLFAAVTVNPVSNAVHPGSQLTLAGTSDLSQVIIKVYRPDHSLLYFNIVDVVGGRYSDAITLGTNEVTGTYVVDVGQGPQISTTNIIVTPKTSSSTSGGGGGSTTTSSSPTVTSKDGKLTLPVGSAGEVSLQQEVTVFIPAGATNQELKITISKLTSTQGLLKEHDILASPIFEILKNFPGNFTKPVKLTFAFDKAKLSGSQRAAVFYYDEAKKVWVEVTGGLVSGNQITVETNHFTKYAVMVVGQADDAPATGTKPTINFSDIAGKWYEANIKQAVSSGMVSGYPDGTFRPNRTVTRAEFAVMLMNTLKMQGTGAALTFTDKGKIAVWAQQSVAQAVQAGILTGYEDGTFRPNAEITRSEMAVMIAKALGQSVEAASATGFTDDKDIPVWAKGAVGAMKKLGIIGGKGANTFAPGDKTTRAESVTVLLRMLAIKSK